MNNKKNISLLLPFLLVVIFLYGIVYFVSHYNKESDIIYEDLGPGLACVYIFETDYELENHAAITLSGGDNKVIKSWNKRLGNFEKIEDGQYVIYDYACEKDFAERNFLLDLRPEDFDQAANLDINSTEILFDTYKNFYFCDAEDVGITSYDIESVKPYILDESIYNKCEKIK